MLERPFLPFYMADMGDTTRTAEGSIVAGHASVLIFLRPAARMDPLSCDRTALSLIRAPDCFAYFLCSYAFRCYSLF
jgi:hypothetical protein